MPTGSRSCKCFNDTRNGPRPPGDTLGENPYVRASLKTLWNIAYAVIYVLFIIRAAALWRSGRAWFITAVLVLILYLMVPACIGGGGQRMRIPVEGLIVLIALSGVPLTRGNNRAIKMDGMSPGGIV